MYNEKMRQTFPSQRVPTGRSRPTMTIPDLPQAPALDMHRGGLNCDGTRNNAARDNAARDNAPRDDLMRDNVTQDNLMREGCADDSRARDNCAINSGWGLIDHPLAMVYSPLQEFRQLYEPEIALERGTLFAELDFPFEGGKGQKGGCNL